MTQEEKAKAYDEALKEAIIVHKDEDRHLKATLERIFPSLKESEDERIRKALISILKSDFEKDTTIYDISVGDIIAWLEKQGEQKYTQRDIDNVYLKGIADAKREVEKIDEQTEKMKKEIAEFIFNSKEDIKQRYEWIKCLGFDVKFSNEDKQSEQKPVKSGLYMCTAEEANTLNIAAPKFCVGAIYKYDKDKGINIGDGWLGISDETLMKYFCLIEEKQSPKFIEAGKWYVCIRTSYRPNGEDFIEGKIYYANADYKMLGECGEVDIATDNPGEFFRPATKDEIPQDLEQKPVDTKKEEMSDEEYCSLCMDINCDGCPYVDKSKHKKQKPTEWSEEDEKMYNVVHDLAWESYKTSRRLDIPTFGIINDWLKSLRPQKQQEWSKDDEIILEGIIGAVSNQKPLNKYQLEWLNSLRPQKFSNMERNGKNWKPSDEQMKALSNAGNSFRPFEECHKVLWSLYNDLKKLREE